MKPIEVGTYRLRNGHKARVSEIMAGVMVSFARGVIDGSEETIAWNADDGFLGDYPGPWDLVERLPDAPNESVLTILRREHAAMMTIADSHAAISKQALASAQEIEHWIQEMERSEG
jgi:ABC-type sulfate transport system substrate-binding protein